MKKFVYLAAAAAVALTSTAASANPYSISVSRHVFLDGGLAGSSLLKTEVAQATVGATHSTLCTLSYGGPSAPVGIDAAVPVSDSGSASGGVTLTADRVNPKGMAIGEAIYTGTFTATASASNLSCAAGGTYEVITQEAQQGPLISEATTTSVQDEVCRAARKALVDANNADPANKNLGYAYGDHCPDIVTVVPAVYGSDIPEVKQTFSYSYTLGTVSTTYSAGGTGTLDGVSFTF
jgi:hypothetical protein